MSRDHFSKLMEQSVSPSIIVDVECCIHAHLVLITWEDLKKRKSSEFVLKFNPTKPFFFADTDISLYLQFSFEIFF